MKTGRARRRVSLYLQKAGAPEPARLENALDFQRGRFSGLPILCHHTDPQSIDIHLALVINKAGSLGAPATMPSKLCNISISMEHGSFSQPERFFCEPEYSLSL